MLSNCTGEDSLRVPWTARRLNQSILKEINSEYSLEGVMLKLKLQYFDHLMPRPNSLEFISWCLERGQAEERATEDEIASWHHWLNGREFEQTLGDREGQGSLACCSPRGRKESAMTEWLNNNDNKVEQWQCIYLPIQKTQEIRVPSLGPEGPME